MARALLDAARAHDAPGDAAPGTAALAARCVRQAAGSELMLPKDDEHDIENVFERLIVN